jgi:hypothetical protein
MQLTVTPSPACTEWDAPLQRRFNAGCASGGQDSPARRTWCIQDACGHCLAHCEHIRGEHIDQRTAVDLAKAMIRDGRMPTPEEAERQLQERRRVTSPPDLEPDKVPVTH